MGVILSCCALQACWCCVTSSIPCCCGLVFSITKSIATRITYTTLFLLLSVLAWGLELYVDQPNSYGIPFVDCPDGICGIVTVYRITFALFLYHALLSLMLVGVKNGKHPRAQINDGWWPVKFGFLGLVLVADFFVPITFFTYYAWVALFGAGVFIIIQIILLVDLAYSWSQSWVNKWQNEEKKMYYYALLFVTFFLFFLAACFDVFNYSLFCFGDCWWNSIIITAVILMCLVLSICSILPKVQEINPRVGLLQAAIFSLYCSYYVYSAILSEPVCGQLPFSWAKNSSTTSDWLTLIFGAAFTIVSVVYSSVRVGTSDLVRRSDAEALVAEEEMTDVGEKDDDAEELEDEDIDDVRVDDEATACAYNYSLFHLAFALGAMYVCMLLTNWSIVSGFEDSPRTDSGWVSVSVKLGSCFIAGGLYLWTVFAPAILPNREWD